MPGMNDTDQYDNATLGNWVLTMGGMLYARIVGGYIEYDDSESSVDVTNILGGLGSVASHDGTGLITCQHVPSFDDEPLAFPCSTSVNNQVFIYGSGNEEISVMSLAAFALSDEPSYLYGVGK